MCTGYFELRNREKERRTTMRKEENKERKNCGEKEREGEGTMDTLKRGRIE